MILQPTNFTNVYVYLSRCLPISSQCHKHKIMLSCSVQRLRWIECNYLVLQLDSITKWCFSCFIIYVSVLQAFRCYNNIINRSCGCSIHNKIKFTYENKINNTINYLDLTTTKNLQKKVIDLEIYHKPTSNTTAIHNKSRHPFPTKIKHIQQPYTQINHLTNNKS